MFPNFDVSEFKCPCGCTDNPNMDCRLVSILQAIRNKYGRAVHITSGYRCKKYNDGLEGSIENSDHIKGKAADIKIDVATSTLVKRKEIMEYIRHLNGFKYAYCNGWYMRKNGSGYKYNAA